MDRVIVIGNKSEPGIVCGVDCPTQFMLDYLSFFKVFETSSSGFSHDFLLE
jgi:hypothetical protein